MSLIEMMCNIDSIGPFFVENSILNSIRCTDQA